MTEIVPFKSHADKAQENVQSSFDKMRENILKVLDDPELSLAFFVYSNKGVGMPSAIIAGEYNPEKLALMVNNTQELQYLAWEGGDDE